MENISINNNLNDNGNSFPIIVSNSYIKKYYLDNRLEVLPKDVKSELKKSFVKLSEEIGGVIIVCFNNDENDLSFDIKKNDEDYNFDEIAAKYKLSRLEKEYEEVFTQIASFCKFKFNGLV